MPGNKSRVVKSLKDGKVPGTEKWQVDVDSSFNAKNIVLAITFSP
jgi:hypothetical protein